jgi:hypothetical protein
MLRFDLDNENETIINYQDRIRQCEALGEFAMAEQIREILGQEQDHQIRSGLISDLMVTASFLAKASSSALDDAFTAAMVLASPACAGKTPIETRTKRDRRAAILRMA